MSDETYNGWTNRETWAVALHVNNDQGWQESVHDAIREALIERGEDYSFGEVTDDDRARWAGNAIRDNVESALEPMDDYHRAFDGGRGRLLSDGQWGALSDIGSLWRVDWTELGRAFLADIEDES